MEKATEIRSLLSAVSALELSMQSVAFGIVREAGNYEVSEKLLGVARDLHAIGERVEAIASRREHREEGGATPAAKSTRRGNVAYPRFAVSKDRVVKIGKGKSRKAQEYRHEAPRESFERLVSWLDEARASGRREWLAQDVVEALAGDVPSYQVYLMLAAMSASGIVSNVRKGSYEVTDPTVPTSEYWSVLRENLGTKDAESSL